MLNSNFFQNRNSVPKNGSKNRNLNSVCPIGGLSIGLLRDVNNYRLPYSACKATFQVLTPEVFV